MPNIINAVLGLEPSARGHHALIDAFRYLGSHAGEYKQTLVSLHSKHHLELERRLGHHLEHHLPEHHIEHVAEHHEHHPDLPLKSNQHHLKAEEHGFHDSVIEHVDLPHTEEAHFRYFAEHHLYPVLYSKQPSSHDHGHAHRSMWLDFSRLNEAFASKLEEVYKPGDLICIHDYHLCLVPRMLRQKLPHAKIGFFLNTPFPHAEFIRCLISRDEILGGMLGASSVIFQAEQYAQHFRAACHAMVGTEILSHGLTHHGRTVHTEVMPIGINVASLEQHTFHTPAVTREMSAMKRQYAGKKIIVTTDRFELVRCSPLKLLAFEKLLERHPQWRDRVVLVQWVNPTTVDAEQDSDEHALASRLSAIAQRINTKFGSLAFSPVRYVPQKLTHDEFLALMRAADVGLFTSVRDSMSRNSLSYVVCQRENQGPLLLSEFSGTASALDHAIKVNPWHLEAVADAIEQALEMDSTEREETHEKLHKKVCENTVQHWADRLVSHLSSVQGPQQPEVQPLRHEHLQLHSNACLHRLILLDYDGTLTPIVQEPSAAVPSEHVHILLRRLAANEHNSVWVISGRDQKFLSTHLGHIPGVGLAAEHGAFIRHPHETSWQDVAAGEDMAWRAEALRLLHEFAHATPGAVVEEKKTSLTWHYRQATDSAHGEQMALDVHRTLEQKTANGWRAVVVHGHKSVEIRPNRVNKGAVVAKVLRTRHPDLVFCAGDDKTDEDMFGAVNQHWVEARFCCKVGKEVGATAAGHHVESPEEVHKALEVLCERPRSS